MTIENSEQRHPVVLGAGPAGLTAAYELTKLGLRPVVLEKNGDVGGLALTADYRGFHFDMGGHRFFTKVPEVQAMWHEVLGDKFLRRPRMSRIFYNGKFFQYPLKPFNALGGLGIYQAIRVVLSYAKWQVRPYPREDTFEQWVTNRFGKRLFLTFFKTYTEKVWGVSCSELKAEWAAQRIKDLSLRTAVLNMFLKPRRTIKTLIEEFDYPRLGPGMMWKAVRDAVESRGGSVRLDSDVARVHRDGKRVTSIVVERDGRTETITGTDFISSMPVTELIAKLDPPAPEEVQRAARKLTYRDFLTVCLVVDHADLFPDNWIYIHDPSVHVGRIQNYKNWSPDMVPDQSKSGLGLEYFCTEGDEVWSTPDRDLIELGKRELEKIGLARAADVSDGCVIRVPKAYPVYDTDYGDYLAVVRQFVDAFENLQTIGRNGLHRYNNQDHAMVTGMLSVRNMMFGESNDLWAVNTDAEYHEEIEEAETAAVSETLGETLGLVFSKLDRTAFALAVGSVSGVLLFLATAILVLKGGETVGPTLGLLSQYFPGYTVTPIGALLGLLYGFMVGFAGGWLFALVRNGMMVLSSTAIRRRAEWRALRKLLDYV